jgi:hypothetical protein
MFHDVVFRVDRLTNSEAADRPTAAVLLNHPFSEVDPNYNFAETKLGKSVCLLRR